MSKQSAWTRLAPLGLAIWMAVAAAPAPASAQRAADDDQIERDYRSANGLLNRGLYDLATEEYRKFLAEA